jgi:hypothetical protein
METRLKYDPISTNKINATDENYPKISFYLIYNWP